MKELFATFATKRMVWWRDQGMEVNYDKFAEYAFHPIVINTIVCLAVIYLAIRLFSIIYAGMFNEHVGILWFSRTTRDSDDWHFEFWMCFLFLEVIAGMGGVVLLILPFIIYGLLFIWPLWILVGLMFFIRVAKDNDWWKKEKVHDCSPKIISEYERNLMKGL